jgi:hypothetical protein
MFEYSGLGDGPSRVRLSSPRLEQPTPYAKEPPSSDLDHYPDSRPCHRVMRDGTPAAQRGDLIAFQPASTPQSHHIEPLVSSGQTQVLAVARKDYSSSFPASSDLTRSDNLPARVFLNSTSHTFDGRPSSGGRTDTHSSKTIHPSPIAYPVSLPQIPLEHVSSKRPRGRGSQAQSYPIRGHLRPRIVLPTPLSPTRYVSTEVLPLVPEQLPPVDSRPLHDARSVGGHDPADGRLGHFAQVQPEGPEPTRTTLLSSPSFPRQLRHIRGDIGMARRLQS